MNFSGQQVVVTGGTGALGAAVVEALVGAGATCHLPFVAAAEAERFALRRHPQVNLVAAGSLADEAAVAKLYESVPKLWASIHLVGGFAMANVVDTRKADLLTQVETNFITAFLCCRAAVAAMIHTGAGGR